MKRIASKGIALTVLAILAMSGEAAAFTPVPIPSRAPAVRSRRISGTTKLTRSPGSRSDFRHRILIEHAASSAGG
jgi:hypothetical protein